MITDKQVYAAMALLDQRVEGGRCEEMVREMLEAADAECEWKATVRDLFDECHRDRAAITKASVIAFIGERHRNYFRGDAP